MTLTRITITGKFTQPNGLPSSGTISAILSNTIQNGQEVVEPIRVEGVLNGSGHLVTRGTQQPFVLVANNDPETLPLGTGYIFQIKINNANVRQFTAIVPHNAVNGVIDITELTPVTSLAPHTEETNSIPTSQKGADNGVASLNSEGYLTEGQLPKNSVTDGAGRSAPLRDAAGNQLVNIPSWQSTTLYPQGFVVQNGGVAYMAATTFTSGASFGADGTSWAPLSSAELAYTQATSEFTTTSLTAVPITGLGITVPVSSRPFMLELWCWVKNSAAAGGAIFLLHDLTGGVDVGGALVGGGTANESIFVTVKARLNPASGSRNYQAQVCAAAGGNTVTIGPNSSALYPYFLQATQV